MRIFRSSGAVALIAGLVVLSGCATPTPYQPVSDRSQQSGGFHETPLEQNRYRISFRGNFLTSRETVELYLLYRAAELTLTKGFDGFSLVSRHTDENRRLVREPRPAFPGWEPAWAYYGPYHLRGPGWDPFMRPDVDYREIRAFESTAEIVMFKGPKPEGADAFDARQVQSNLSGKIVLPAR